MTTRAPGRTVRPPLVRQRDGRLLAGVATGVATHLGIPVAAVRIGFAVLAVNGIGALAYIGLWLLIPIEGGDRGAEHRPPTARRMLRDTLRSRPDDVPGRRTKLLGYAVLGASVGSLLHIIGFSVGGHSLAPLCVAGVGALLIWWRAPQPQRDEWATGARRYGARLGRYRSLLIAAGGIVLVIAGVTSFLAANNALAQARDGAIGIAATFIGVLLVTGPWLLRLIRELTAERRVRIREQERAEVAAHVHDSVLQTLALIQGEATDPAAVRRLARRQERELRTWLYAGSSPDAGPTVASALREVAADIEDTHNRSVEVVVVGDAELDESLRAMVAAAREAMVNAAKSSGAPVVSVFAEVTDRRAEIFVRDRGAGFDLDRVPEDRRGIRDSIIGRMQRHGGTGEVRTGKAGTEVTLSMARSS